MKKEWTGMPTSDAELREIAIAIKSTYDSYRQIEEANSMLSETYKEMNEKYGIPRRVFNFLGKDNYLGNAPEIIKKNSELEEAAEVLKKVSV